MDFVKIPTSSDIEFLAGQDLGIALLADDRFKGDDLGKMVIYQYNVIGESCPFGSKKLGKRFQSKMQDECGNEEGELELATQTI